MSHSTDELFALLHRYYPRGIERHDPAIPATEEYQRRVAARRIAVSEYEQFRALLSRLRAKFPEAWVQDQGLYHPEGYFDACYAAKLVLPTLSPEAGQHALHFRVSFLVPYYLISSIRVLYVKHRPEPDQGRGMSEAGQRYARMEAERPDLMVLSDEIARTDNGGYRTERTLRYTFTEEEAPYAQALAAEIEQAYGAEALPPAVGEQVVPKVAFLDKAIGHATVFDCLFAATE